ncbi:hypothetical protein G6N76_02280 [Rhizobium daejeonense]|uniref:J domain-containing protein n=1 Tax=Rhizobium daejeonense TaxID=240521 RepID=A0A6M1S709_9HYPH|nr:hypothetical protein [Rhizobium daejeonense]NGO62486.1 hypothetical protein [Rhizobium daejeonense]
MLFRQSLFESVVERLSEEGTDAADEESPAVSHRIHGMPGNYLADSLMTEPQEATRLQQAYLFLMEDGPLDEPAAPPPPQARAPVIPARLVRLSLEEIAEDLGIAPTDDREKLAERRRQFARLNHPDKVDADFRERATKRMKIANLLIDEAIRRLS